MALAGFITHDDVWSVGRSVGMVGRNHKSFDLVSHEPRK